MRQDYMTQLPNTTHTYNDFDMRMQTLHSECRSCNQTTSSNRNNKGIHLRDLFADLQPHGALTRQDVGMVIAIHVHEAFLPA